MPEERLKILLPTPIGELGLSLKGSVITRVVIDPSEVERGEYLPFAEVEGHDFLDEVFGRFSEYFAGARTHLELEYDLSEYELLSFARRVFRETAKIPIGKTRTYNKIAELAGRPEAYRQVLAILMTNPLPILIPCHRVVTHKSGIGSFVGGQERKRWLIAMEKEVVKNDNS